MVPPDNAATEGVSAQARPENGQTIREIFDTLEHRVLSGSRVYMREGASLTQPLEFYFAAMPFTYRRMQLTY
jgi:hypothetical protein